MLTLFWDEWGVILEHYMPRGNTDQRNVCRSPQESPASCNQVQTTWTFWVQVFCCNMTMLGPVLPFQLLQQSKICPSNVFHIRRTCQASPQVIFTSLDHSKRRWEASLSGPTKRCSRRCTNGCTLSQKTFFSRGIHALSKRWNTFMEHNGDYVEKWCHCVPYVFNKLRDKNI